MSVPGLGLRSSPAATPHEHILVASRPRSTSVRLVNVLMKFQETGTKHTCLEFCDSFGQDLYSKQTWGVR